jgi:hypothetical protein
VGVVLAIAATGGVIANAQGESHAVRPEDTGIRALIASGMERSATFRDLKTRLDNSDVIVYVRFSHCAGGVAACLVWASAGADPRRLVIKLDRFGRSPDELTVLLAHELQHSHEVASAPEITDVASFGKIFASRGWKHGDGFETEQAREISRRVAAELNRAEHGASPERRPRWTDRN